MSRECGEDIGYREVCDYSFRELAVILAKRCIALPSKLIGFKPLCLALATGLLLWGKIGEWVWFAVLVCVLFGIVGLKVLAQMRQGGWQGWQGGDTSVGG